MHLPFTAMNSLASAGDEVRPLRKYLILHQSDLEHLYYFTP